MQALSLQGVFERSKWWVLLLAFIAVCLHGMLLHEWIDIASGQNLNFFNMLSLSAWLVSVLVIVVVLLKPVEVITLFVFPFTALTIILILAFPAKFVINTLAYPDMLFHILISVFTFCVLCVAALLAICLAVQEYQLRRNPTGRIITRLPPLESMEGLLFQVMSLGFILLSVVLITSVYTYHSLLQHYVVLQKTVLVLSAWVVFAILLVGRYRYGWRGRKAIYGTLIGVAFLVLAYFASKLVMEVLT